MLKNMSIKSKLILVFVGFFAFLAGLIFYSIQHMNSVGETADKLANDRIPKVMALSEISQHVNVIARTARNMYIFKEKSDVDEEKNTLLKSRVVIGQKLDYLKPIIRNPKAVAILGEINIVRADFIRAQDKFIVAIDKDEKEEAYNILIKDFRPIQLKYMTLLETLLEFQSKSSQEEANNAISLISSATKSISIISLIAAIIIGLIGYAIIRSIVNSIHNLEKNVIEIGQQGNFDTKIDVDSKDEIGAFAGSFQEMMKGMKDMLAMQICSRVRLLRGNWLHVLMRLSIKVTCVRL